MPTASADQEIIAAMKQREFHIKRRQRAADTIHHALRRYRAMVVAAIATVTAVAVTGVFVVVQSTLPDRSGWWRTTLVVALIGVVLGVLLGQRMLGTSRGRRLVAGREDRLLRQYSGDLHAGRRWLQFDYRGEDISAYVPQILYFIEADRRFESVDDALAFVKANQRRGAAFVEQALDRFDQVAKQTNIAVVTSSDETGNPSSRIMRFVRSERLGVWYVASAPEAPKVREFDQGRIALVTLPTESGATISSNRVRIRRLGAPDRAVTELYRDQVPGYLDAMTDDERQRELVYEVTLQSARVSSWLEHDLIDFCDAEIPDPDGD